MQNLQHIEQVQLAIFIDDGKNAQFAEPFGYSFKGWAVANNKGFSADDAKIYSLYDDIPNTVTHLNAICKKQL